MNSSSKIKILIVEDNPIIATDIEMTLESGGYHVVEIAHSALKAIDALARLEFDFAVLDVHLGKGDTGVDVAKVIHATYKFPYIFLTSFSDKATLEAAQEHSPYGYLVKPFQEATLLSTIAIALSNHQKLKDGFNFKNSDIHLTDQEESICKELYSGKSYQEIANTLYISINTVRFHVKNLYSKFDVKGRAELISKLV